MSRPRPAESTSLRSPRRRRLRVAALTLGILAGLLLGAPPVAADDDDAERRGSCSRGAEWEIKASPDDGRIDVEGEVDSDRTGQLWRWRMFHNESLSAHGSARTDSSGSFDIGRVMTDLAGTDSFSFRARNMRTGEWCRGPVRI